MIIVAFKITKTGENLSSILEKMNYETRCRLDGVMDELGLSKIYIQAKRYKDGSNIGRQEIQQFIGAISNKNTKKASLLQRQNLQKRPKRLPKIVKTLAWS